MDQMMSVVEERRQSKCAKLYREILQPRNISFGSTECLKTAANLNLKHKGNIKTDSCYVFDKMLRFYFSWLVAVSAGVGSSGTSSFYVIPHPIFWLTVPYGLLLCFASALFPSSIPDYLPLGPLARYDHYPF